MDTVGVTQFEQHEIDETYRALGLDAPSARIRFGSLWPQRQGNLVVEIWSSDQSGARSS